MRTEAEKITLLIEPSKKKAFLEMLKMFDFVKVESTKELIRDYIKSAPKKVTLTDNEIMQEVNAVRKRK